MLKPSLLLLVAALISSVVAQSIPGSSHLHVRSNKTASTLKREKRSVVRPRHAASPNLVALKQRATRAAHVAHEGKETKDKLLHKPLLAVHHVDKEHEALLELEASEISAQRLKHKAKDAPRFQAFVHHPELVHVLPHHDMDHDLYHPHPVYPVSPHHHMQHDHLGTKHADVYIYHEVDEDESDESSTKESNSEVSEEEQGEEEEGSTIVSDESSESDDHHDHVHLDLDHDLDHPHHVHSNDDMIPAHYGPMESAPTAFVEVSRPILGPRTEQAKQNKAAHEAGYTESVSVDNPVLVGLMAAGFIGLLAVFLLCVYIYNKCLHPHKRLPMYQRVLKLAKRAPIAEAKTESPSVIVPYSKVVGYVVSTVDGPPVEAPISGHPCVFYSLTIEDLQTSSDWTSKSVPVFSSSAGCDFIVSDGTGTVRVAAGAIRSALKDDEKSPSCSDSKEMSACQVVSYTPSQSKKFVRMDVMNERIRDLLAKLQIPLYNVEGFKRNLQFHEEIIPLGQEVVVAGRFSPDPKALAGDNRLVARSPSDRRISETCVVVSNDSSVIRETKGSILVTTASLPNSNSK